MQTKQEIKDEYKKIEAPAWAEYWKIKDSAMAKYLKIQQIAWAEKNRKLKELDEKVSTN